MLDLLQVQSGCSALQTRVMENEVTQQQGYSGLQGNNCCDNAGAKATSVLPGNDLCDNRSFGINGMNGESLYSMELGSYSGSFSELLMSASCGLLGMQNQKSQGLINGYPSCYNAWKDNQVVPLQDSVVAAETKTTQHETNFEVENGAYSMGYQSTDEGYLGGQECGEDGKSDSEDDEWNYKDSVDADQGFESQTARNIEETNNELFSDFESDGELDNSHVHFGDCGCTDGNDICISSDSEGDSEVSSQSSGSDGNGNENEIDIEIDLAQEIFVDNTQYNVPYKKRKRNPKIDNRPNCRKPRSMGTIERAMRASSARTTEHIFEPYLGLVFDSKEEAKEFYNLYSWEVGFGVKYCNSRSSGAKNDQDQGEEDSKNKRYQSMQEIVCQNAGTDARLKYATRRCNCKAKIRLLRTDDYGWYISFIEKEHNHPLSKTCGEKREWTSHRLLDPYTKDMIKYLRENNVSLTKVHCILGSMFGSMEDVPWTKRSLRTVCNQITRDNMDDDIKKTMEIFRKMRDTDPGFKFSVELDKKSRIKTLLWCSGRGQEQYTCFGDVVTFDTTYCTNIYKMPFGLFVGVNNHFQTTIFAGVLMRRETAKSFKWVFREFMNLMGGKAPQTILTDQCKAMTKAIRIVMPDTYHLWCKWHVMKKIRECLGPLYTKDKKFRDDFWLVVNGMLNEEEFEAGWKDLITRYKLEENSFMKRTYKCKKKWAKPWSRDKFCARMSSTQRSESANFMLKRFVPRNSSMNHFVSQYNRLLLDRDREEEIAEHRTKQVKLLNCLLWPFARHAHSIYTKAVYDLFQTEVDKASNFVVSKIEGDKYTISHDSASKREHWCRVHFKVEVMDEGKRYVCECGLYEHFGILCCHTIRLMMRLDVRMVPEAHIMKRWTRDARDILPGALQVYQKDNTSLNSFTFRHRLSVKKAMKLVDKGDMDMEMNSILLKHMDAAENEMESLLADRRNKEDNGVQTEDSSDDENDKNITTFQSDGEALARNRYGAAGSSAEMSDTAILRMKAPAVKKKSGRRRTNRFMAGWDKNKGKRKKKVKKAKGVLEGSRVRELNDLDFAATDVANNSNNVIYAENTDGKVDGGQQKKNKGGKRVVKCGKCKLVGHNATQCCSLEINEETAAGYI